MSFKENLLQKIEIDTLSTTVMKSIGSVDSGIKIDRTAMARILEKTNFEPQNARDLTLYVRSVDGEQEILVFDNELALYKTSISDVLLRKSPTLKEMISIRNAIKILNDKDVVLTKRSETVLRIKNELLNALDLSYNSDDVNAIVSDGADALENSYGDGVAECLMLLAEMLEYGRPPKALALSHYLIFGQVDQIEQGPRLFGPMIVYSRIHNTLRWIDRQIDPTNKHQVVECKEEISSDAPSDRMGESVLIHLSSLLKENKILSKQ